MNYQLELLDAYKRYENSLKWLKDLNINGYNFQIDQPTINWKEIFDGKWLKDRIISVFGWPWYILENIATLYAMVNFFTIRFNVIVKFYNAFAIHKAIGKQVSLTRILLSGIFGIFSHTLTQLIADAQDTNKSSDDDNNSHETQNSNTEKKKLKFTMIHQPRSKSDIQITESPSLLDDDNDVYVDINYKHYNATIRRSKKGIQLKNTDHKSKPSVPTRKSSLEPLHQELLATINDKGSIRDQPLPKIPSLLPPHPLITPPPYQTRSSPEYSIKDRITRLLKRTKHQSI